jgi:uncharacterized protein YjbK
VNHVVEQEMKSMRQGMKDFQQQLLEQTNVNHQMAVNNISQL